MCQGECVCEVKCEACAKREEMRLKTALFQSKARCPRCKRFHKDGEPGSLCNVCRMVLQEEETTVRRFEKCAEGTREYGLGRAPIRTKKPLADVRRFQDEAERRGIVVLGNDRA